MTVQTERGSEFNSIQGQAVRKDTLNFDNFPSLDYICPQNHLVMQGRLKAHQSPQIVTIEAEYEGIVCSSNESLDENYGEW